MKEKINENNQEYFKIVCTLYDKPKERIVSIDNCSITFKSKKIDEDLKNSFGDKDMIVLS